MAVGVVAGFCEWGTPQPTRTAESWLQVLQVLQVGVYYHVWGWPDWLCCATEASKRACSLCARCHRHLRMLKLVNRVDHMQTRSCSEDRNKASQAQRQRRKDGGQQAATAE
jgi:hypothetical protein